MVTAQAKAGELTLALGLLPEGASQRPPTSLAWASPSLPSQGGLGPHGPVPEH